MKIYSFVRSGFKMLPVEVEVILQPGLPMMQILGSPSPFLKESQTRIPSAIKNQGFEWPAHKKVLVNLKPANLKKTSAGLELAIVIAFLKASEQLPENINNSNDIYAFGRLSLDGKVDYDTELDWLEPYLDNPIITGVPTRNLMISLQVINELQDLYAPSGVEGDDKNQNLERPKLPDLSFEPHEAELLRIMALGGHPALMAGAAGSGKSTMAQALYSLLPDLNRKTHFRLNQIAKSFGKEIEWRPLVQPHHTIPTIAMVGGGGGTLWPGEITRAHGGLLVMDEFLEFQNQVKETLREPLESGQMTVTRAGHSEVFPAHFQLVATTNLCPCGKYLPNGNVNCNYSLQKCKSYLEKLSGPLMDRFDIVYYAQHTSRGEGISLEKILSDVQAARAFIRQTRPRQKVQNARLKVDEAAQSIDSFDRDILYPELRASGRRKRAFFTVARSIADLKSQEKVTTKELEKAYALTVAAFNQWNRG